MATGDSARYLLGGTMKLFAVLMWSVLNSATAAALALDPNPVEFDSLGIGAISITRIQSGIPSGGVLLNGSTSSQDMTVLFSVSLESEPLDGDFASILIYAGVDILGVTRHQPTGAGWIPGDGIDIASASVAAGSHGESWQFVLSEALKRGTNTDVIFASFDAINPEDFVVFGIPAKFDDLSPTLVISEPRTESMLACVLSCLAFSSRFRR
jgi:hypothetical protein